MRNVLVHDSDEVNLERLWDTTVQDIPLAEIFFEQKTPKVTKDLGSMV